MSLKSLKKLVINSIEYSSLNDSEKNQEMIEFEGRWKDWIYWVVNNYSQFINK